MAKRKNNKIHHPETKKKTDGYLKRKLKNTYSGSKNFAVKHGMTSIIALLISSVMPMLEQWHTDKQYQDQIEGVANDSQNERKELESRIDKKIDDLKNDENEKIKALWTTVGNKQDKRNYKEQE